MPLVYDVRVFQKLKIAASEKNMKLHKPTYNAAEKQYLSKVEDGIRLTSEQEGGVLRPTVEEMKQAIVPSLIPSMVDSTKGWFTKPLTQEWLQTRCELELPTPDVQFEGKVVWELQEVIITKDKFRFLFVIVEQVEAEQVVIQLEEPVVEEEEAAPAMALDPTRRVFAKQKVLKARAKAARALFKAERLTQEYMEMFGEDTDWEDEDSGMESP